MTNQDDTTPSFDPTLTNRPLPRPEGRASTSHSAGGAPIPKQIGLFKILRQIGEGGMGTVYEAVQDSPKRTVALKVIRAGLASSALLKRFALESQVLGRLQHPGIAQVYQAGTADTEAGKLPYFAMEYVRGVDVRRYVSQQNLHTRDRLKLLAQICDAVHHAHQKGVIHRDLKPGNILVDQSGQPKILDFGVARATDADMQVTTMQTDVGQIIGTLQYMSPEQVAADPNDLDTRSDVYALGVIAYEILTGQMPYDLKNRMIHEAARIIREEEPTSPSTIDRVFRGDIENIVAKALAKEKDRRYQSAAGLAEDIRRYLEDEPILARPPSAMYQLQKFAKRNKALAGGLAIAISALIIGVATSTVLYIDADNARQKESLQRKVAEQRAEEAKQVQRFMVDLFKVSDPSESRGNTITAREILDRGAERVERELSGQPLIQATLLHTLGSVYRTLGLYRKALPMAQEALRIRKRVLGDENADVAMSLHTLAMVLLRQGRHTEAEKLVRQSLAVRQRLLGDMHTVIADSLDVLGVVLNSQAKYAEAMASHRDALAMRRRLLGDDHPDVAISLINIGHVLRNQGQYNAAEKRFRRALLIYRKLYGNDHPGVAQCLNNIAIVLNTQRKFPEAENLYREALKLRRRFYGSEHPFIAQSLQNLGSCLNDQGRSAEAEPLFREALAMFRKCVGDEHRGVADNLQNLGDALSGQGKYAASEAYYLEALAWFREHLGEEHPAVAFCLNNLAATYKNQGKYADAEKLMRQVLAMRRKSLGETHPLVASSINSLASILDEQGKYVEAEQFCRQSLEMKRRLLGNDNPSIAISLNNLSDILRRQGKDQEALQIAQEALKQAGTNHPALMDTLALALDATGKVDDAIETARTAIAGLPPDPTALRAALQANLAMFLSEKGSFAEAELIVLQLYEQSRNNPDPPPEQEQEAIDRVVHLYDAWHKAVPNHGYDQIAAEWKSKLLKTDEAESKKP